MDALKRLFKKLFKSSDKSRPQGQKNAGATPRPPIESGLEVSRGPNQHLPTPPQQTSPTRHLPPTHPLFTGQRSPVPRGVSPPPQASRFTPTDSLKVTNELDGRNLAAAQQARELHNVSPQAPSITNSDRPRSEPVSAVDSERPPVPPPKSEARNSAPSSPRLTNGGSHTRSSLVKTDRASQESSSTPRSATPSVKPVPTVEPPTPTTQTNASTIPLHKSVLESPVQQDSVTRPLTASTSDHETVASETQAQTAPLTNITNDTNNIPTTTSTATTTTYPTSPTSNRNSISTLPQAFQFDDDKIPVEDEAPPIKQLRAAPGMSATSGPLEDFPEGGYVP